MASEALDIPDLNTLVMATARKEIEQTVGRILRKQHEVQPIVVDIVDQLPSFSRQGMQRRKFYKTNNYVIKIYEVEENEIISVIDEVEIAKPKKIIQQNIDNDEFLD
jgi:superfamily II DNA or RNA helicase